MKVAGDLVRYREGALGISRTVSCGGDWETGYHTRVLAPGEVTTQSPPELAVEIESWAFLISRVAGLGLLFLSPPEVPVKNGE
jgi:hypothetical protein